MLFDGEFIDANRPLIWDEPENHLHPEWQVEFAKVLVQMYKSGKPIIITTHSPYFLQAIRYFSAKERAEDFVTYYMAQPTEDGFVEMEDVTNDLNKAIDFTNNYQHILYQVPRFWQNPYEVIDKWEKWDSVSIVVRMQGSSRMCIRSARRSMSRGWS